jgi:hypothetical protein
MAVWVGLMLSGPVTGSSGDHAADPQSAFDDRRVRNTARLRQATGNGMS